MPFCTKTGRSFVGTSPNVPARFNRHKSTLKHGVERNRELVEEWKTYGESSFEFELLDELEPDDAAPAERAKALETLAEMWVEQLTRAGKAVTRL